MAGDECRLISDACLTDKEALHAALDDPPPPPTFRDP
jgi:hypothetical protein